MIKSFLEDVKNIDKKIVNTMFDGFKISLLISLLALYILTLYNAYPFSHIAYLSGLLTFKLGLTCVVSVFICGFTIDKIK